MTESQIAPEGRSDEELKSTLRRVSSANGKGVPTGNLARAGGGKSGRPKVPGPFSPSLLYLQ